MHKPGQTSEIDKVSGLFTKLQKTAFAIESGLPSAFNIDDLGDRE